MTHTANMTEILATVKTLQKRYRTIKANQFALASTAVCHLQIAKRRIDDAKMFAGRNDVHATKCLWEARNHLNLCNFD